jgi:uncharacterized protein (DUF924 family)
MNDGSNAESWEAVLTYWFGEEEQEEPPKSLLKRWFAGGEEVDKEIKNQFDALHQELRSGLPKPWKGNAKATLAAIIVIDQFSRNLFRRSGEAFTWDPLACDWSLSGWESGLFNTLTPTQQAFSLMPLMHSENLSNHIACMSHFEQLLAANPSSDTILTGFCSSAQEHHDIIAMFGRYPHRNSVLNRSSTPAEAEYLQNGAKRFGQ